MYPSALAMTNSSPPSAAMSIPSLMWFPGAGLVLFMASSTHVEGIMRFPVTLTNSACTRAFTNGLFSPSSVITSFTHV